MPMNILHHLFGPTGGFLLFLLLILFFLKSRQSASLPAAKKSGPPDGFRKTDIMTANEAEFFGRLKKALPSGFHLFPQVASARS